VLAWALATDAHQNTDQELMVDLQNRAQRKWQARDPEVFGENLAQAFYSSVVSAWMPLLSAHERDLVPGVCTPRLCKAVDTFQNGCEEYWAPAAREFLA
jgi:hypothetical protein